MKTKTDVKEEQIKLEFNALLEEFKTVRENILFDVDSNRQVLTLTLTSASILVAGSSFIIQSQFITLFLVMPIIFYALAWSQVRYLYLDASLSSYLNNVLAPRLRKVLADLTPDTKNDYSSLLSWETYLQNKESRVNFTLMSIGAARYSIPMLLACLPIMIYFIVKFQQPLQPIPFWDIALVILNAVLLLYTVYLGFWAWFILPKRLR